MVPLDRQRSTPIYLQIAEAIRTEIAQGRLPVGSRMPTVRSLASSLKVARQTVVEAYRLLCEWGLIEAHVGRGTRVASELPQAEATVRLAGLLETGPIADFESVGAAAGMRSLATAVPDPKLFMADELLAELSALRLASPWTFYYAPPAGVPELRQALADLAGFDGMKGVSSANVVVTLGAFHAVALLVDEFCSPGDTVWIQSPGFLGLPEFLVSREVRYRFVVPGLPLDETDVPRLILLWPSFGPAAGLVLDEGFCGELLQYAERHGAYVVEDAHYRRIAFDQPGRLLRSLSSSPLVIHVDALSGCLSPGVRTGWIVAEPPVISRVERRVRNSGCAGLAFVQLAVARYLAEGGLAGHLERSMPRYHSRRNALLSSLGFAWPKEIHYEEPLGGLSVWITLPPNADTGRIYESALGAGVPFAPGAMFGMPPNTLRLSFGTLTPEAISEAGRILGQIVSRELQRP